MSRSSLLRPMMFLPSALWNTSRLALLMPSFRAASYLGEPRFPAAMASLRMKDMA